MAGLVVLVFALLVIRNVSSECFDDNVKSADEAVCIPGHWNIARVNSATITTTNTCGNPPSTACPSPGSPQGCIPKCDSSDPKLSHPVRYIVDTEKGAVTYWQSDTWWVWHQNHPNTALQVNITLNFNKSFDATGLLTLTFESPRPYGMILEKSSDFGKTWSVLQYYASDCQGRFNMKNTEPSENNKGNFDAFCTQIYSTSSPRKGGQVLFDFRDRYELEAEFFKPAVQKYLHVTNFRFQLVYPATDGTELTGKTKDILSKFYYAISDLTMIGRCRCNGHAASCVYNNSIHGINKCRDCMHFTDGLNCEKCLPLYNNRTWSAATSRHNANPCQSEYII